jgi:hypothetical protein
MKHKEDIILPEITFHLDDPHGIITTDIDPEEQEQDI